MSMTREEAIMQIESLKNYCEYMADSDESGAYVYDLDEQALDLALSALRPVSRAQVEKVWRGEWEHIIDPYGKLEGFICKCGTQTYSASNFCPHCGGAKTDEAVQMVMERLEALKDGKGD